MALPSLPSDLSVINGVTTRYAYDAAGRMVREGSKTYRYGWLDKVTAVVEGDRIATYEYHADGQLARAIYAPGHSPASESFEWDGLALVRRGDEQFMNEPHIGGGNPVASSKGTSYFNDALGTMVGSKSNGKYSAAALTAFGEGSDADKAFFTGKPMVEGLGHAFWMRNYRAGLAKWQSADPMGYPDGWNALAYCGNGVTASVDLWGCKEIVLLGEVNYSGYHIATVWAECNHSYDDPEFTIFVGQLKYDPDNRYVMAVADSTSNVQVTPNTLYQTKYKFKDAKNCDHEVSIANVILVEKQDSSSEEFPNMKIDWVYQVKFDVHEEWWDASQVFNETTFSVKQDAVSGKHYIGKHSIE